MRTLLIWLLLAGLAAAQGKVFVNNKPFKGKIAGSPADIQVEAAPFFEMIGARFAFDASTGKATVDGEEVEVVLVDGTPMLAARAYATKLGGKYTADPKMGSIDIYAYDPMAAARKALVAVLRQPKITNESDFHVLTTLSRSILQRDLGLKLTEPAELVMVTPEEMAKAGAGGNIGAFVRYTKERSGKGTANYHFLVRTEQTPMQVIRHLAWMWGTTWALNQGLDGNNKLTEGFGTWVAFQVTKSLAGNISPGTFLRGYEGSQVEGFKKLAEIEATGGVEAVLHYIQEAGKAP